MMGAFPTDDMELTYLLVVSDLDRSRAWYTRVLGATVVRDDEACCVLDLLGTWLLLAAGSGPAEDEPAPALAPPAERDRVSAKFVVRVPDCRDAYETLRARGADFLAPPVEQGDELRAVFRDPDGHLFEISAGAAIAPRQALPRLAACFISAASTRRHADAAGDEGEAAQSAGVEAPPAAGPDIPGRGENT
jgi:catechol 2,3-dioxygenase-like lactoylglutathione lyase family enzyme